jgi:hypothetical protein
MTTQIISPNVDATFLATLVTLAGNQTLTSKTLKGPFEFVTVSPSAPATTLQYDVMTQGILYYTGNATTNFTWNIRGNAGTTLNALLPIGQSVTCVLVVTNGATPYYPTAFTVDGSTITPKYPGGSAITGGSTSALDVYTLTLIKTASATYTALVSQIKYA